MIYLALCRWLWYRDYTRKLREVAEVRDAPPRRCGRIALMGLTFRRAVRLGRGRRLNVSRRGVSVSRRLGRVTLSSRGRGSIRLGKGFSWRFKL